MPTNKFHYIWMGRLPTGKYEDSFKNGPNDLARQLNEYVMDKNKNRAPGTPNPQDQEIIMWVPEDLIEGIKASGVLNPEITLKPVEDLYRNAKHLTEEERANLKKTVDLLGENNAYASQKDILSAAILEEYGGYFLDTTTAIDSVETLINHQPKDVWFPRVTNEAEKLYDGEAVILPDVWAMYNPKPGGGTFKAMIDSYVQRCQFYFPEKFEGAQIDIERLKGKSGYNVLDGECYGKGSEIMTMPGARDKLIGETAIFSLLDGLNDTKGPLTDRRMKELSSFARVASQGKKIEELGLEKFHKGMWRNQTVAENIEDRVEGRMDGPHESLNQPQQPAQIPTQNRKHSFEVRGSEFEDFKTKYQSLRGDILKSQIISDFKDKLDDISDKETLDHFVDDFKKSISYKVLSTGQDLTTKLFFLDTSSQKKVEGIIKEKEDEIARLSTGNVIS